MYISLIFSSLSARSLSPSSSTISNDVIQDLLPHQLRHGLARALPAQCSTRRTQGGSRAGAVPPGVLYGSRRPRQRVGYGQAACAKLGRP